MVQGTSIQPCYSDLLWTFQQSQWGGNCHLFLPLSHLVFSQPIKFFLFISAWPDFPTDQLCPGEFSSHPLPVITALHSQTLEKSCWKHPESQPQLTEDNSWTLTELPIPPGILRDCPLSPAHMERGSVPKNNPSSPAQGCPSTLCPIEARYTWIPQIMLSDAPCCNAFTVLSCMENLTKPVDEQENYTIMTCFKLPHKHGNPEREYYERGSSVQQVWWEEHDPCTGSRLKERKYFFLPQCKQWSHICKPGSGTDTFLSVKWVVKRMHAHSVANS